jgi:hypothetical protein
LLMSSSGRSESRLAMTAVLHDSEDERMCM